jgi:hypothetical protein
MSHERLGSSNCVKELMILSVSTFVWVTDLNQSRNNIIFESFFDTFISSVKFWGSYGWRQKRVKAKIKPPFQNLTKISLPKFTNHTIREKVFFFVLKISNAFRSENSKAISKKMASKFFDSLSHWYSSQICQWP